MNSPRHFGVREFVLKGGKASAFALMLSLAAATAGAQEDALRCAGGERMSIADLRQGPTVAIFWASWSPRSRDVFDRINAIAGKWGGRAKVVAINYQEDPQEVRRFLAGRALSVPVCFDVDGSFSNSFDVSTLPQLVVLKGGREAGHGRLDDADRVLGAALP